MQNYRDVQTAPISILSYARSKIDSNEMIKSYNYDFNYFLDTVNNDYALFTIAPITIMDLLYTAVMDEKVIVDDIGKEKLIELFNNQKKSIYPILSYQINKMFIQKSYAILVYISVCKKAGIPTERSSIHLPDEPWASSLCPETLPTPSPNKSRLSSLLKIIDNSHPEVLVEFFNDVSSIPVLCLADEYGFDQIHKLRLLNIDKLQEINELVRLGCNLRNDLQDDYCELKNIISNLLI